jgi:hypothetical protein
VSRFTNAVREFVSAALSNEDSLNLTSLAKCFIETKSKLIEEHAHHLVHKAVRDEILRRTHERPEDSGQMSLFPGLPAAIRVAENDFRPRDRATWADLQAGRQERVENIANAEKALALYDDDLERLRPYMEDAPEATVADAIKRMHDAEDSGDQDPAGSTPVAGGVAPTTAPVARGWAAGPSPGSVAPESP